MKYEIEITPLEAGEELDPAGVRAFENWLEDVLDSADFGFRVSGLNPVGEE